MVWENTAEVECMKKKRSIKSESNDARRTTIFLTEALNENLDALALITGRPKGEIVRQAVSEYIRQHKGFDPSKKPKITVSYLE